MIYLMSDGTNNIKIGYAINPNKRWKTLKTGNPELEIEALKPGSTLDEKALHKICKPYHYKGEWFLDCKEVRDAFDNYNPFSDSELQKLKNWVDEKSSDLNKSCHKESFIEEKLEGVDLTTLSEDWQKWIGFYEDRILYSNLLSSIEWIDIDKSCIKKQYTINIDNIVIYPIKKLEELQSKLNKGIDIYNSEIKRRKELKEDLYKVSNSSTRNVLEYEIKQIDNYLSEKLEQINKIENFIKETINYITSEL